MNHDSWLIRIDHHWKLLTNQTSNNQHWIKQVNHHQQAHCHHHHDHHHHLRGKVCRGLESLNEPDEHLSDERKVWLPEVLQRYQPDRPVVIVYLPILFIFTFCPCIFVCLCFSPWVSKCSHHFSQTPQISKRHPWGSAICNLFFIYERLVDIFGIYIFGTYRINIIYWNLRYTFLIFSQPSLPPNVKCPW